LGPLLTRFLCSASIDLPELRSNFDIRSSHRDAELRVARAMRPFCKPTRRLWKVHLLPLKKRTTALLLEGVRAMDSFDIYFDRQKKTKWCLPFVYLFAPMPLRFFVGVSSIQRIIQAKVELLRGRERAKTRRTELERHNSWLHC